MASTNKTPQLGLNQWAAGDPVLREDFNRDNGKIEAAVAALQAHEISWGTYTGPDVLPDVLNVPKSVDVGFMPQIVLIMLEGTDLARYSVLISRGHDLISDNGFFARLTDTGFEVCNRKDRNGNIVYPSLASAYMYTYLAMK